MAIAARAPGVSVSKLALSHQLNTNMVFKWRREYLGGRLSGADREENTLLPVVVVASLDEPPLAAAPTPALAEWLQHGSIVIEIGGAVVPIDRATDAGTLRLVIASLRA